MGGTAIKVKLQGSPYRNGPPISAHDSSMSLQNLDITRLSTTCSHGDVIVMLTPWCGVPVMCVCWGLLSSQHYTAISVRVLVNASHWDTMLSALWLDLWLSQSILILLMLSVRLGSARPNFYMVWNLRVSIDSDKYSLHNNKSLICLYHSSNSLPPDRNSISSLSYSGNSPSSVQQSYVIIKQQQIIKSLSVCVIK